MTQTYLWDVGDEIFTLTGGRSRYALPMVRVRLQSAVSEHLSVVIIDPCSPAVGTILHLHRNTPVRLLRCVIPAEYTQAKERDV